MCSIRGRRQPWLKPSRSSDVTSTFRSLAVATIAVALTLLSPRPALAAAEDTNGATVANTRTPDAPAFVLLGASPTQVERPTTPRALALSVLSSSASSDNLIPKNYALQVAPYWLVSHPSLSNLEYYHPSIRQGLLDTLSFSVVSSRASTVAGQKADANQIGVGVRTGIVVGHANKTIQKLIAKIHALQLENTIAMTFLAPDLAPPEGTPTDVEFVALIDKVTNGFHPRDPLTGSADQLQAYLDIEKKLKGQLAALWNDAHRSPSRQALRAGATALLAQIEADLNKAVQSAQVADDDRRGFALSIAGASAWLIPDAAASDGKLTRWGVWATPSFRPDTVPIEAIAVVRAIHRPDGGGDTMYDVGGRVTHETGHLNWSFEYVERFDRPALVTHVTSERAAAILDVRVRDDVYVTVGFGKDFADPTMGQLKGGLLSSLGLSFGFGEKPTIALK
jgi:hypothetical protein